MTCKQPGNRKFYQLPSPSPAKSASSSECGVEDSINLSRSISKKYRSKNALFRGTTRELVEMVERNIVGPVVFQSPFGPRRSLYLDHTASGQPLRCIEDFVRDVVLPYYGNTHTTTTITSSQTTMFRQEAKDIVRNAVGAGEHDVVIFCGYGCTGAVHKLIQGVMGDRGRPPPIVFVGPFEHHSNFLPWKDAGAKVVYIPETKYGVMDVEVLEERLQAAVAEKVEGRRLIGNFSVASNVTGCLTDDVAVTVLMHKYGGLAFWDYSAAAAHIQICMNPVVVDKNLEGMGKKDAMFFSGHKLVGGPQTPGVLVAKKSIFESSTPNGGGGGSVFFVTQDSHRYLQNTEYREEGGTPAIIESIRLGLVFRLKETIGSHCIVSREAVFAKKMLAEWTKYPEIKVLGSSTEPRLGIISFIIEHLPSGYYLHHNYVVALLNDLFGIQSRGGCACAGPYGQSLLGIDIDLARKYENLLLEDSRLDRAHLRRDLYSMEGSQHEIFRPGFVRVSVPFHASSQDVDYLIEAVQIIARHGYKLLPLYDCNPETGEFHHHANHMLHHRKWLSWGTFDAEGIRYKERTRNNSEDYPNFRDCMEQAKTVFYNAHDLCKRRKLADQALFYDESAASLRWFMLPSEAMTVLSKRAAGVSGAGLKSPMPFRPKVFEARKPIETEYCTNSVPSQIMQSAWCEEPNELRVLPHATIDMDSIDFHGSNSIGTISSHNSLDYEDAEMEFLVTAASLGTTVTGPSICFSSSKHRSKPQTERPPYQRDHYKPKSLNNNATTGSISGTENHGTQTKRVPQSCEMKQTQTLPPEPQQMFSNVSINGDTWTVAINGSPDTSLVPGFYTPGRSLNSFPFPDEQIVPVPLFNNNHLIFADLGNNYKKKKYPCPRPRPTDICPPIPNDNHQVVNGGSDYGDATQCQNIAITASPTVPQHQEQQPSVDTTIQPTCLPVPLPQSPLCNSPCLQQSLDSQYYSAPEFCTNLSSPATPSPVPQQYSTDSSVQSQVINPHQNNTYLPVSPTPGSLTPSTILPASPSPNGSTVSEQMVENAMRRVTDEIASELKSEIRGVISQVEQGIEGGLRERANSFTFKDRKIESLKRRSRTLSGHSLNKSDAAEFAEQLNKTFHPTGEKNGSTNHITHLQCDDGHKKENLPDKSQAPAVPKPHKTDVKKGKSKSKKVSNCVDCQLLPASQPVEKIGSGAEVAVPTSKWHCPPKNVFKPTLEALREFSMIKDGDKVLVCLSGGKDSLSLLHCMRQAQFVLSKEGINFILGAVTVDPKHAGFNPKPLIPYMKSLGVPYFFEEQSIMATALEKGPQTVTSICSFCSRMKRGRIYATARKNGYNVLAFGQHLDDLAESFMMSIFHNGLLRTMKASYMIREEDLRVVRPFVYVREKFLRDFAESRGLPIIPENCPACFEAPTERHRVKQLFAHQEILFPKLFLSLRTAMKPLMAINRTGMESKSNHLAQHLQQQEHDEDDD